MSSLLSSRSAAAYSRLMETTESMKAPPSARILARASPTLTGPFASHSDASSCSAAPLPS